jgi:hypothetical protein
MLSEHRKRAGLAAAFAAVSLVAAAPAGADPNPAQRIASIKRSEAAAQEQYYMSHKPAVPGAGHKFDAIDAGATVTRYDGRELRTVDASEPAPPAIRSVGRPAIAEPPSSSGFEWGDAAIASGATLGVVLLLGGAAVVIRRSRPVTS